MAAKPLESKVILQDVVSTLAKPEDYVRRVVINMDVVKKEHGDAFVGLGVTGRGIAPHYRVAPGDWLDEVFAEDEAPFYVAFNGRSHKQMPWSKREIQFHSWSSIWTPYDDVVALMLKLRAERKR